MSAAKSLTRRLVAGVAACATLLTGLAFAGTANADDSTGVSNNYEIGTYDAEDHFGPGALRTDETTNLIVTKYTTTASGVAKAIGSVKDKKNTTGDPAPDVVFTLTQINPVGIKDGMSQADIERLWSTVNVNTPGTWETVKKSGTQTPITYWGKTNAQGVIDTWYNTKDGAQKSDAGDKATIPTKHYLYLLHEVEAPAGYSVSEDSIFDLPYRATNRTETTGSTQGANSQYHDGFVYNLHVYPKNVSTNPVNKTITEVDNNGTKKASNVVMNGDVVHYAIAYRFAGVDRATAEASMDETQKATSAKEMYLSDATSGNYTDVRLSDRLSSAFKNPAFDSAEIDYDVNGDAATPIQLTKDVDFKFPVSEESKPGISQTIPMRIHKDHTGEYLFSDTEKLLNSVNHTDTGNAQYLTIDFFGATTGASHIKSEANPSGVIPTTATNVRIVVKLHATASSAGDNISHTGGLLVNDVASDDQRHDKSNQNYNYTASAGFEFAKVGTDSKTPIQGAKFRLADPKDSTKFLASDGKFYAETKSGVSTLPSGVYFLEATSSATGIVQFTNLPLFKSAGTETRQVECPAGRHEPVCEETVSTIKWIDPDNDAEDAGKSLTFDVVEIRQATGYKRVTVPFKQVSWASKAGQAIKAGEDKKQFLPDGWTYNSTDKTYTVAADSSLNFKEWAADPAILAEAKLSNANGDIITLGLKNWKDGETGEPIHLPLTGGQGIILLLVLGAAIMAVVIIERKRRASKARR